MKVQVREEGGIKHGGYKVKEQKEEKRNAPKMKGGIRV